MATEDTGIFHDLFNIDPEARLQTFDNLCRRTKTSEPILDIEFLRIRRFIYFNINISDQGFRQRFLTSIKYLLIQLKESGYSMSRSIQIGDEDVDYDGVNAILKSYQDFIEWVVEFCFYCLRLHGNYARRVTALRILELVYQSSILVDDLRGAYIDTWTLRDFWTPANVSTIVASLADPYESNQALTLNIIRGLPNNYFQFLDWSTILKNAFDWVTASKTQYPEIAVYYFLFVIDKADLTTLMNIGHTNGSGSESSKSSVGNRNRLLLLHRLLTLSQSRADAVESSLIRASMDGPPWGLLKAILFILKDTNWESENDSSWISIWTPIIEQLLAVCRRLISVVTPVVNSSSPEGYLPMDMTPVDASLQLNDGIVDSDLSNDGYMDSESRHYSASQAVLVCSWRTQKEISALFGHLASIQRPRQLLTLEQLREIGRYFLVQLTECKHRGAFECAYAAFVDVCRSLWTASDNHIKELPTVWLRQIIDGLVAISEQNIDRNGISYCVTRRSAGVPYLVQAVLATEPKHGRGKISRLLCETLEKLLRILFDEENAEIIEKATAKVHALNILRALVREAKLGFSSLGPQWLSLIAQADLLLFTHTSWAVRNSATLLFSSWMVRIFGVSQYRDRISAKNRMSIPEFEAVCPDLLDFLLQHLRFYSQRKATGSTLPFQELILFPILNILTRLYPTSASSRDLLKPFILYVLDILFNCPIVNVRRSAAAALCSIMDPSSIITLIKKFDTALNGETERQIPQNALHGILLLASAGILHITENINSGNKINLKLSTKLCPINLALRLRISSLRLLQPSIREIQDVQSSNANALTGEAAYGCIVNVAVDLASKNDDESVIRTLLTLVDDRRFRTALYKELKLWSRTNLDPDSVAKIMRRLVNRDLLWNDITGNHDDLNLQIQACKLLLAIPTLIDYPERHQIDSKGLLRIYFNTTRNIVRRQLFRLACQFYDGKIESDQSKDLVRELDSLSRPERPLDDRLLVVKCLARLDPQFLKDNHAAIMIIMIRLLTDLEDYVQEKATTLVSRILNSSSNVVQSELAIFIFVAKLVVLGANGRRALKRYLQEIVDELDRTREDNSNDERIFDKNESNYNLEPLLIAKWTRILSISTLPMQEINPDMMDLIDQCLSTDALKHRNDTADAFSSSHILQAFIDRMDINV